MRRKVGVGRGGRMRERREKGRQEREENGVRK